MTSPPPNCTAPIIKQIEALVADVPGWSPIDQLYTLFQLAYVTADLPGDIVEVGAWCGRSALALGLAARLTGRGRVHSIDLFPEKHDWLQASDGTYSMSMTVSGQRYKGHVEQTVWQEPFARDIAPVYTNNHSLLELFLANVARHRFQDVIVPFRGNSDTFARSVADDFRCRLIFIDGEHSYTAVCRDYENLERFLLPGGWMCFDDAFSSYAGVNRAIEERIINSDRFDLYQQVTRKCFIARKRG